MKTQLIICIVLVGLMVCSAWNTKQSNKLDSAEWLLGTWENKTAQGSIYETWSKTNEVEFAAMSYVLNKKDTIVYENIRLVLEDDELFYIPIVNNQNDGLAVRFINILSLETQLIFENKEHDFPQMISYTKKSENSLIAEISGTKNGRKRKITFPMNRLN